MHGIGIQLDAVSVVVSHHVPGVFHNGELHAQAQPQERQAMGSGIVDGRDLPLDTSAAEAARHQQAVHIPQKLFHVLFRYFFRIDPFDMDVGMAGDSAVLQRLHHAEVGVMERDVLAHQGDGHFLVRVPQSVHHALPVGQIGLRAGQMQAFQSHAGQMLLLHGQRRFIEIFHIQVLKHMAAGHVAEQGDLVLQLLGQRMLGAAYDDIGLDAHALQLLDAGLGGFRLQLSGSLDIRNQRHMNQNGVLPSHIVLELADGLQERLALDIAHRTAHLDDGNALFIHALRPVEAALYLIGDMRDNLNRTAAEIPVAFLLKHGPVNLSGSHVGVFIQAFIDKPFIVSQIQVRLRPVVGDKNLSMLDRVHGARIDVDIGIKFLHGHLISAGFQKPAQRSGRDTLAKAGHHSACYKHVLYCHWFPSCFSHCFIFKKYVFHYIPGKGSRQCEILR